MLFPFRALRLLVEEVFHKLGQQYLLDPEGALYRWMRRVKVHVWTSQLDLRQVKELQPKCLIKKFHYIIAENYIAQFLFSYACGS